MYHLTLIQKIAVLILPVLFAITFHELAHGFVATKLGDKTAQILGRLSANPLKHIDIIGTIIVPAVLFWASGFIFGWAKPVPVNPANFRSPKRDMALVALAGPMANLIMAILWALIAKLGFLLNGNDVVLGIPIELMGYNGIVINIVLMLLNLIPILPLDGGRIVSALLPGKAAYYFDRIEPFGFLILVLLIALRITDLFITPLTGYVIHLITAIFGIK